MRAGMDEATGRVVTGWGHVEMVIRRALTTRPGALVLRRKIGSLLPALQDENMVPETVLRVYVAIAEALSPSNPFWGEPGFRLRDIRLVGLDAFGQLGLIIAGDYYPDGHLGDYSRVERGTTTIPVREVAA
jgi:phage baseplate assembly protein W